MVRTAPLVESRDARPLALLWGAAALGLVLFSPWAGLFTSTLPVCPVKSTLGLPCPGCGATRSALALARFDPLAALRVSPLATLAWSVIVVGGLAAGVSALLRVPLREPSWRWSLRARLGLVALIVANWLYLVWAGV